ncbi:MAG: hypothetical protein B7733_03535 [Myxococcales bacterium FL481]|nr:MAG: hypothetical protein B7733_03535 [Myxococcales bacterium FL481]
MGTPRTRRAFCEMTATGLVGVLAGAACNGSEDGDSFEDGESLDDGGVSTDAAPNPTGGDPDAGHGDTCQPTVEQTPGPYPQAGLEREDLDLYGHDGVAFELRGRVLDPDCQPIAGATVLLWHATPSPHGTKPSSVDPDPAYQAAVYDHESMSGATTPDDRPIPTGEQMYYGWVRTDANGHYRFRTLRPGWYLNGAAYRTSHLHARVFVAGEVRITTQLYFADDDFNEHDLIYVQCLEQGDCIMPIDAGGNGSFDFVVPDADE